MVRMVVFPIMDNSTLWSGVISQVSFHAPFNLLTHKCRQWLYNKTISFLMASNTNTYYPLDQHNMSSQFHNYSVELSNQKYDGAYIKFAPADDHMDDRTIYSEEWLSSGFPPCNNTYFAEASRCSRLAPFDDRMKIFIRYNVGHGDGWCGASVMPSDYDALDRGVEIEISSIVVSGLYYDECDRLRTIKNKQD